MPKLDSQGIVSLTSDQPGPALAIFAGVHGNERAGVEAIKAVLPTLQITRGSLYIVIANPPAVEKGVRQVGKNLNRCFFSGNTGQTYEDERARKLMKILDKCEALLDLHGFEDKQGKPFIICEKESIPLAEHFDPDVISIGWSKAEPGATDGYMHQNGKVGVCFECGPIAENSRGRELAVKTIFQFLSFYNLIESGELLSKKPKRIIKVKKAVIRTSSNYKLDKSLHSFAKLKPGQIYGSQDGRDFAAQEGEVIIFPHQDPKIGSEAFLIGVEI